MKYKTGKQSIFEVHLYKNVIKIESMSIKNKLSRQTHYIRKIFKEIIDKLKNFNFFIQKHNNKIKLISKILKNSSINYL